MLRCPVRTILGGDVLGHIVRLTAESFSRHASEHGIVERWERWCDQIPEHMTRGAQEMATSCEAHPEVVPTILQSGLEVLE